MKVESLDNKYNYTYNKGFKCVSVRDDLGYRVCTLYNINNCRVDWTFEDKKGSFILYDSKHYIIKRNNEVIKEDYLTYEDLENFDSIEVVYNYKPRNKRIKK